MNRRDLVKGILGALCSSACGAGSSATQTSRATSAASTQTSPPPSSASPAPARPCAPCPAPRGEKLRVLCVGAHPDDPETGCGGTLARYAAAGHDVHVLYATRGELGIVGKPPEQAAAIRTAEAEEACRALGAKPHFFGQKSGAIKLDMETSAAFASAIDALAPDIVFGHWPIDTEYDHQVTAALTIRAYLAKSRRYPLYLFEVEAGTETLGFVPTAHVEIGPYLPKKLAAIRAHKSQDGERRLYERHHEPMERFRAREIGGTAAEAFFVLAPEAKMNPLPGL